MFHFEQVSLPNTVPYGFYDSATAQQSFSKLLSSFISSGRFASLADTYVSSYNKDAQPMTVTSSSMTSTTPPLASTNSVSPSRLSTGAIAGIAVSATAFGILLAFVGVYFFRKKTFINENEHPIEQPRVPEPGRDSLSS